MANFTYGEISHSENSLGEISYGNNSGHDNNYAAEVDIVITRLYLAGLHTHWNTR